MRELFKGYVPTKHKECLMKFKGKSSNELKSYREVKDLPEYAAILAENTILIDVDDFEESEKLMNIVDDLQLRCRVYETTRGKHFLFANDERCEKNRTKAKLACGLVADIKLGCRTSYSILKYNGKEREIIYDIFEDEEYEPVPKWLLPINSKLDFLEMKAGDGRNQSLFNYILTLQSADYSNDEARECIRIINKYILNEPLADSEIDTILRDDSFKKPMFFKKNTFLFDKFALFIKNNNHIIKIDDRLHIYQDGVYKPGDKSIQAEMIKHIPNLNKSKRAEVLAYLDLVVKNNIPVSPAQFIAFRNGIYDLATGELEEFSPDRIITNKINFNFNPDAKSELLETTLDKLACGDEAIRALLEEAAGYTMYRRNELRKAFILTGDRRNGKSTYLAMIERMLGKENISSLDMKELGERFKTAELFGKLANIGDDIDGDFIASPGMFKKLVSGSTANVERKGGDPFDFTNYSKFLFSANEIPRIRDKTGAVIDRLVIIPFNARFSKDDPDYDPFIKYKLLDESVIEALIVLAVEGLKRVLKNQEFTKSEKTAKAIADYEEENSPILLFFKNTDISVFENEPTNYGYKRYTEFCVSNGLEQLSNIAFSKAVKKYYGLTIINKTVKGKKYRLFVKEG